MQNVFERCQFIFENCKQTAEKCKQNLHLPNTFWLYQHGVKNAYCQSYSHLNYQILYIVLVLQLFKIAKFQMKKYPVIVANNIKDTFLTNLDQTE